MTCPGQPFLSPQPVLNTPTENAIWMTTPVLGSPAACDAVEEKLLHVLN